MVTTNNKGSLIWITGLSGAGKSTLAKALIFQLKQSFVQPVIHLDGDDMRSLSL